jgi:hypothetical protein
MKIPSSKGAYIYNQIIYLNQKSNQDEENYLNDDVHSNSYDLIQ